MGRYIVDERVKFPKGLQRKLLESIKDEHNLTWKEFAARLGISEGMLSIDWRLERCTLPKSRMKLLAKMSEKPAVRRIIDMGKILPRCWGQTKGAIKACKTMNIDRVLTITQGIEKTPSFAELVGIILGDGHLHEKGMEITLNIYKEVGYAAHVAELIKTLFGKEPRIRHTHSTIRVILNSKLVVKALKEIGLKTGRKGDHTRIPELFWTDKTLLSRCVRGLIDTDGGIHKKERFGKRHIIEFKNMSQPLLDDVRNALALLGFQVSLGGPHAIRVQHQSEIKKYLLNIGTSNGKNTEIIGEIFAPVVQRQDTSFPRPQKKVGKSLGPGFKSRLAHPLIQDKKIEQNHSF